MLKRTTRFVSRSSRLTVLVLVTLAMTLGAWAMPSRAAPVPGVPQNCTYTQGFWKNHSAHWPVDTVMLGDVEYTAEEAMALFDRPTQGDATYVLVHQLLAAKLNLANGADDAAVAATVAEADAWLVDNPLGSRPRGDAKTEGIIMAETLDAFNNGLIGPGHCDAVPDEQRMAIPTDDPTPDPTDDPTPDPTDTPEVCLPAPDTTVTDNGFEITFVEVIDNGDGTTTWRYRVVELEGSQDLSNWVLGLGDVEIVDATEPNEQGTDPNSGLKGIKWETEFFGGDAFEEGYFEVTVEGPVTVGTIPVGAKGPRVEYGEVTGPVPTDGETDLSVCEDPTPEPTDDPTTVPTDDPAPVVCPPAPIDFNTDAEGNMLPAGTMLDEQWSSWGIHITAESSGSDPDQAILFDSANPTSGDSDLGAPNEDFGGPGVGAGGAEGAAGENAEAQGMMLILPEYLTDQNGDGLVDDPNDARAGGHINFTFDQPYQVDMVKLMDLDGSETDNYVEVLDMDGNLIKRVNFEPLGDNSYQEARIDAMDAGKLHFFLNGSGSISAIVFCEDNTPEPTEDPTTEPTTATPEPTTATPEPTTATPEPTTATPEPTTATPEPTTATPEPTTATPTEEPTTGEPTPTDEPTPTGEPTPPPDEPTPPPDYTETPTETPPPDVAVVCYLDLSATWMQGETEVAPPLADMNGFEIVASSLIDSVTYTYDEGGMLVASSSSGLAIADDGESAPYVVSVTHMPTGWTTWDTGTFEASVDPYTGDCPHPVRFMEYSSQE